MTIETEAASARYHHGNLRAGLLQAALQQLADGAEDEISLRGLAKNVGVSCAAVYRHYTNKDALLAEVAVQGFERLMKRWKDELPPPGAGDARQRFRKLGEIYVEFAFSSPAQFRLMFGQRGLQEFPRLRAAADQCFSFVLEAARETLAESGAAEKWALPLANAAWSLVHGYVHLGMAGMLTESSGRPDLSAEVLTRFLGLPVEAMN